MTAADTPALCRDPLDWLEKGECLGPQDDLYEELAITSEHIQNNQSVRDMLGQRGIKPERLPPEEDIKKLERRVKSDEKKLEKQSGKLPELGDE